MQLGEYADKHDCLYKGASESTNQKKKCRTGAALKRKCPMPSMPDEASPHSGENS